MEKVEKSVLERLDIDRQPQTRKQWEKLLAATGLGMDPPYSAIYGIFESGRLVATGARDDNRLKCVAIDPEHQGGPLFGQLLTGIVADAFDLGINKLYLYTKAEAVAAFTRVGFHPLATTPGGITFMERGRPPFTTYLEQLAGTAGDCDKTQGSIKGPVESIIIEEDSLMQEGTALIQSALARAAQVHLFLMGTKTHVSLPRGIQNGPAGLIPHDAEGYFIPFSLFPSYFLKDDAVRIKTQATLDALLFRDRVAPALGITHRTILDDPANRLSTLYNETLGSCLAGTIRLTRVSASGP